MFMSVLALVKMTALPKKRRELLQTLEALENSTCLAESGCLEYRFYQEGGNENAIILVITWQTPEGLKAYQDSDPFKILKGAMSLLCENSEMIINAIPIEHHH
jgi:quinol monooxygenase YgiN